LKAKLKRYEEDDFCDYRVPQDLRKTKKESEEQKMFANWFQNETDTAPKTTIVLPPLAAEPKVPGLHIAPRQTVEYRVEQGSILTGKPDAAQQLEDILNNFAADGFRLAMGKADREGDRWNFLTIYERDVKPERKTRSILHDRALSTEQKVSELDQAVVSSAMNAAAAAAMVQEA